MNPGNIVYTSQELKDRAFRTKGRLGKEKAQALWESLSEHDRGYCRGLFIFASVQIEENGLTLGQSNHVEKPDWINLVAQTDNPDFLKKLDLDIVEIFSIHLQYADDQDASCNLSTLIWRLFQKTISPPRQTWKNTWVKGLIQG